MKYISLVTRRLRVVTIMKSLHTKGNDSFPFCICLLSLFCIQLTLVNFPTRSLFFKKNKDDRTYSNFT